MLLCVLRVCTHYFSRFLEIKRLPLRVLRMDNYSCPNSKKNWDRTTTMSDLRKMKRETSDLKKSGKPQKKSGNSGPTPLERGWLRGWNHGKLVNNFSHESDVTSLLPTASTTPYFLRSSDPSANFFARPSARTFPLCSILMFGRLSFADHRRAFFSLGDFSTDLFWKTSTRFDLRETFITTFTFSLAVYSC